MRYISILGFITLLVSACTPMAAPSVTTTPVIETLANIYAHPDLHGQPRSNNNTICHFGNCCFGLHRPPLQRRMDERRDQTHVLSEIPAPIFLAVTQPRLTLSQKVYRLIRLC